MEEKWMPKQGELIEVKFGDVSDWRKREFISMTSDNNYLCWTPDQTQAYPYEFVRKIKEEQIYYYRYKKQIGNKMIISSSNFSEIEAKKILEDGFEKILSTKTKHRELVW